MLTAEREARIAAARRAGSAQRGQSEPGTALGQVQCAVLLAPCACSFAATRAKHTSELNSLCVTVCMHAYVLNFRQAPRNADAFSSAFPSTAGEMGGACVCSHSSLSFPRHGGCLRHHITPWPRLRHTTTTRSSFHTRSSLQRPDGRSGGVSPGSRVCQHIPGLWRRGRRRRGWRWSAACGCSGGAGEEAGDCSTGCSV